MASFVRSKVNLVAHPRQAELIIDVNVSLLHRQQFHCTALFEETKVGRLAWYHLTRLLIKM